MQEIPRPLDATARSVRTVLVVDVAESVRLMEECEDDTIARWRSLVQEATRSILPARAGRLVKSLGDGMLIEFAEVLPAVDAAFALQALSYAANEGLPASRRILLRMGMQVGELVADAHDVYGRGVNLAARLAGLAGPGEIVVSSGVRDQLTPALDADIEDLGECHLKHVREPVRAYRIGPPGPQPVIAPGTSVMADLRPTVAVIPFDTQGAEPEPFVLGEVLADEVIAALSQAPQLYVISRLSTTMLRGRATPEQVSGHLNASYVVSGTYRVSGGQLSLIAELSEAKTRRVVWSRSLKGRIDGVLAGADDMIDRIVADIGSAVIARETQRAGTLALPTLESYSLLIGAISLMHRGSLQQFERAEQMLDALIARAPRQAPPHAWRAKWHVLRAQKGWSPDLDREASRALECTKRALDVDPESSLALTIDGFVHTNLLRRLDVAGERYELALRVNPSDSLAWLLAGTRLAFKGEGARAEEATERAHRLSPLDPLRDWYDSLRATAALSAGRYERVIELAQSSLRLNRMNLSALRAMAIAQALGGDEARARQTGREILAREPAFTVARFLERSPSSPFETGRRWADGLRRAGVPEGTPS
jgi:adenylate cyclase